MRERRELTFQVAMRTAPPYEGTSPHRGGRLKIVRRQAFTRAIVVVPSLLYSAANVDELCEQLEVRFLANRDPNLHFCLLSAMSFGGMPTVLPDMQRYVVEANAWLSAKQFGEYLFTIGVSYLINLGAYKVELFE